MTMKKMDYCTYKVSLLDGSHFKVVAKNLADAKAQAYEYLVHSVVVILNTAEDH